MRSIYKRENIYQNDKGYFHREDGPAIEYSDGEKQWWLNGVRYTEEKYKRKIRLKKLRQIL